MFPAEHTEAAGELRPAPQHSRPVPGHGVFEPVDIRGWLEARGVRPAAGDLALYDRKHALLFVRGEPALTDAVDALVKSAWVASDFPPAFRLVFTVSEITPAGERTVLVRRSLFCPGSGKRFKFERRLKGQLVEQEEMEVTWPAGATSLDLNLAIEFRIRGQRLACALQTMLSEGEPASTLLYAAPLQDSDTRAEIWVTLVRESRGRTPRPDLAERAAGIDAALNSPVQIQSVAALWYRPVLQGEFTGRIEDFVESPSRVPELENAVMFDLTVPLRERGISLDPGGQALYAQAPGLLYARAWPAAVAELEDLFQTPSSMLSHNLRLSIEQESAGGWSGASTERQFRLPGKWRVSQPSRNTEEIEARLKPQDDSNWHVVELAFTDLSAATGEQWSYWNEIGLRHNQEPAVIVEGAAADSGLENRRLRLAVEPARTHWEKILAHPVRRGQLLKAMEKAVLR